MNSLVCRALETLTRAENERQLYDAFSLIADDPDTNISFAERTQWEAIDGV